VRFLGQVVQRRRSSTGNTMELYAMDRGFQLSGNQGWYSFRDTTPEAAVAVLAADWGIPLGPVAATGVRLSRKFPGVALNKIIDTLYTLAGQQTGKRYQLGFDGEALTVKPKPETADLVLAPRVNITEATIAEDATQAQNSVAIYTETGKLLRTIDRKDDQALFGLLQAAVTQGDHENAEAEARAILEDGEVRQTVTVECQGDYALVTGAAVQVYETTSGVKGLFWVDGDVHTWRKGRHQCRLTLNFRNLMNDTSAGKEL